MLKYAVAAWLVGVKWPLTFLLDAFYFRPIRRAAAAGFDKWAAAAAKGGPAAVARAVAERVTYFNDPLRGVMDFVTAPAATWARRRGDCDDFAYLAAELLRRAGRDAWLATYFCWRVGDAHVVSLYRDGGAFGFIDQGTLTDNFPTLEEAARAAAPARAAATLVQRYGRGADFIGRWIIKITERKEV